MVAGLCTAIDWGAFGRGNFDPQVIKFKGLVLTVSHDLLLPVAVAVGDKAVADEIEGARNVVGQGALGAVLVATFERFDQRPVVMHGRYAAVFVVDMGSGPHIG